MQRLTRSVAVAIGFAAFPGALVVPSVSAQRTGAPHVVVVRMTVKPGASPYAFEPASVVVQRGDTLRFINDADLPHNVHFKSHPAGARLGAATTSAYLTAKGQTLDIVIDSRFTPGKYEFVCDPHEALGMHGVLTVN